MTDHPASSSAPAEPRPAEGAAAAGGPASPEPAVEPESGASPSPAPAEGAASAAQEGTGPAPSPADELAALRQELEKARAEAAEWKKQYHRGLADYDNLRKRTAKEVLEASTRGKEDLVKKLLPVLDTFHNALRQMEEAKVDKKVMEGMEMLWFQFSDTLEKEGLKPIAALRQKFDPQLHEAMMRSSNPEFDDDIVVREFEIGYTFKDRVIRTAKVEINSKS